MQAHIWKQLIWILERQQRSKEGNHIMYLIGNAKITVEGLPKKPSWGNKTYCEVKKESEMTLGESIQEKNHENAIYTYMREVSRKEWGNRVRCLTKIKKESSEKASIRLGDY